MSHFIIENPLRKEVHKLSSYSKLLALDKARMEKTEGHDVDWLIDSRDKNDSSSSDHLVYQSLEKEVEWLWKTLELLNTGWLQDKLWLDSIESEAEAQQSIIGLLEHTIIYWRTYLESDDPNIFYKMPVLGSRFSIHENRMKAFDLITAMTNVLREKKTMEELLVEWHGGKTWDDYNRKYNFDSSLWVFVRLLDLKKKFQQAKQEVLIKV